MEHIIEEMAVIGFSKECYGDEASVTFHDRIRDEQRFPSREALAAQIRADVAAAMRQGCVKEAP